MHSSEQMATTDGGAAGITVADVPALSIEHVSQRYGAVQALDDVSFSCRSGEVHAVLGANGSGKSTMLGIAAGARVTDSGRVLIGGTELRAGNTADAHTLGLAAVYQDNSSIPSLTVAENLFLAARADDRPSFRDRQPWAAGHLARYELDVDPADRVAELSPGHTQLLEVVKALIRLPGVLLLDEPTTALAPPEVSHLHDLVRAATARGTAVVYVSHRIPEVLRIAHCITVLRDGRVQAVVDNDGLDEAALVKLMLGVAIQREFPPKSAPEATTRIAVELTAFRGDRFGPIDATIRRGEILGIAGAEGNGQRELLRAIAGLEFSEGGLDGPDGPLPTNSVHKALESGTMLLSGDRHRESVFGALSIRENMTIQTLRTFRRFGFIDRSREARGANRLKDDLGIVAPDIELTVDQLSGGNQQKVVMSRASACDSRLLLIDEPTQGVDAGSRPDIYQMLRDSAEGGAAVVLNSSDSAELAGLCDRVLVLSRGNVVAELAGEQLTEEGIVGSFVTTDEHRNHESADADGGRRRRGIASSQAFPLVLVSMLVVALALYTNARNGTFLSEVNIRFMITNVVPLAMVAAAQLCVLLVAGFDVSVGGMMSVAVVLSSVFIAPGSPPLQIAFGVLVVLAIGIATGLVNGTLSVGLLIVPIIATIGTLGILQGVALWIRPVSGQPIDSPWSDALMYRVGVFPVALIVIAAMFVLADGVLYHTATGLRIRATGHSADNARRNGVSVTMIEVRAYVASAVLAGVAGLFLGAQIRNGDSSSGSGFILTSFAACVLGGASLWGGRGTYVGALLGAFLLTMVGKVPSFIGLHPSFSLMITGSLTLLAAVLYSGREQWLRLRRFVRRSRSGR